MGLSKPIVLLQAAGPDLANDTMPMVSIVLATYNGALFLEKQLESLFDQSYQQIEIIAVDDGSSDDTVRILGEHASRHNNMKVFLNDSNQGFIKTFDRGCSLASGKYIAPCDQDDFWDSNKIEKLVDNIDGYPMIFCDSYVCDEHLNIKDKKISQKVNSRNFTSCLQQCIYCRIYGHATLFSKALYKKAAPFITDIPHDWWLCYNATLIGGIKYLDEPLVYYRQHAFNAIGVVGEKRRKHHAVNKEKGIKQKIRNRVQAFYEACPESMSNEKRVLGEVVKTYQDFSLSNNFQRMFLFFRHCNDFLAPKKKSSIMRYLFCFKMFVKIK